MATNTKAKAKTKAKTTGTAAARERHCTEQARNKLPCKQPVTMRKGKKNLCTWHGRALGGERIAAKAA